MPTYYAVIPGKESVSAEIDAPDKRHGRTAYLDYLARNKLIPYTERSRYRKLIILDRVDPGEISTSVKLSYPAKSVQREQPVPEEIIQEVPAQVSEPEVPVEYSEPRETQMPSVVNTERLRAASVPDPSRRISPVVQRSPIAMLSRGQGGRF